MRSCSPHRAALGAIVLGVCLAGSARPAAADKVVLKLGTLAPTDSEWHLTLQRMGQRWWTASKETVELKVFAGGVSGDESDMVRKMKIGQLQAASITGLGLGQIDKATVALQVPMLMESWEELDYVRRELSPELEKRLDEAGFVVLNWADAGWVHFFSKEPAATPDDYAKLKMFVWNGDPDSERAWRTAKFKPIPLASTEGMPGLKTGMVEAFHAAPLFALGTQWYTYAKHMVKVNWTPLNGATIVSKAKWEKIPPETRAVLLTIAREEGEAIKKTVRTMSDGAIETMKQHGLTVVVPDAKGVEAWRQLAVSAYPEIRGKVVPEKYFDAVQRLAKAYRGGAR